LLDGGKTSEYATPDPCLCGAEVYPTRLGIAHHPRARSWESKASSGRGS
jgi:hypothetical protein